MMKKNNLWLLTIILMSTVIFSGRICGEPQTEKPKAQKKESFKAASSLGEEKERQAATEAVVKGSNNFGIDIYHQLRKEKGNHFLSPLSLSIALSMTLEGARSETAAEMTQVLKLPADENRRQAGFARIRELINQPGRKSTLRLANAIWIQEGFPVLKNYLEVIAAFYDGRATNVDFINRRELARRMINDWTAEKTAGKIKDLIPPGVINSLTRLILTNAIYFLGLWELPFNPEFTQAEKFYLAEGQEIAVPMMRFLGDRARFPYLETEDFQLLEMFYEGKDISMLIILPRQKDLTTCENKLTFENLETWKSQLSEKRVDVYLPRFKVETKYFLKGNLETMGMTRAFSERADFSGINGQKDLFIQQVIHQAFVEVNESGTEAAAASGVLIGRTAYVPEKKYIFRADHPFIFLIQEKTTGAILFLGRLADPR